MATLTFHVPYDMQYLDLGDPYDAWDAILSSSQVTLYWDTSYQDKTVFQGSFRISGDDVSSGTITRIEDYVGGVKQVTATGLSCSVSTYKYYASRSDGAGFLQDILKYNDSIVGSSGTDVISTFAGNDTVLGGAGNDQLYGFAGNDILNGGSGADTMVGGAGNDVYHVDSSGDRVYETTGTVDAGGLDTVYSYRSSWSLGAYIENARIQSTGTASLTGNTLNNVIYAGTGSNAINGGSGTDTVSYAYGVNGTTGARVNLALTTAQATGGSGSDKLLSIEKLIGSKYNDTFTGNSLANSLTGGAGNDLLKGASGNDILNGGTGNDVLTGGSGRDQLTGGSGADRFDFNSAAESGLSSTVRDVISDFVRGVDKIDLSTIDASTSVAGNQAFRSVIASASTFSAAGQLQLKSGILYGNVDADAQAEFAIALTGISALSTSDFIL